MAADIQWENVFEEIRTRLVANATLTGLLGDATMVYLEDEPVTPSFPVVVGNWIDDRPDLDAVGHMWNPQLDLTVLASKRSTIWAIIQQLDAELEIPRNNGTLITGTNFNLTRMRRTGSAYIGASGYTDGDGYAIKGRVTSWVARVGIVFT